jgi:cellulose synthase/poly-beta-1,6-N-acetylglucosamine synthase-like glycosyltransferase/putative flippase GtrA
MLAAPEAVREHGPQERATTRGFTPAPRRLVKRFSRQLRFIAVGGTCFVFQLTVLFGLIHLGLAQTFSDAIAFFLSAQLNFTLSSLVTWRDRPAANAKSISARWLAYNGTALLSLGINTAIFVGAHHVVGVLPAAAAGVAGAMTFTYLICNRLVFRSRVAAGEPDVASTDSAPPSHGNEEVPDAPSAETRRSKVGQKSFVLSGVAGAMIFTYMLCSRLVVRSRRKPEDLGTAHTEPSEPSRDDGKVRDIRSARKRQPSIAQGPVISNSKPTDPKPSEPKLEPVSAPIDPPRVLSAAQKIALVIALIAVGAGLALRPFLTLIVLNAALVVFFLASNLSKLDLIRRSYSARGGSGIKGRPDLIRDEDLPVYTLLLPVYHESAVVSQLMSGIARLNYPHDRLDVKLLLEEDDFETREAVRDIDLPWVEVLVVPDVGPKGKPRACNFGLARARGDFLVIYDAEDRPEPDQLRKAVAAFECVGPEVVCLQAKLNYFNRGHNVLTRWFTAEYSMWFDQLLPGLQSLDAPIPLGGTSNHFVTTRLRELGGWNAYNVTEDADLGIRIFLQGWKTAILDSTTYEEATSRYYNWVRQRSRWVKGYMQTYLFFMRRPIRLARTMHAKGFLVFQLFFGAATLGLLINPFFWMLTVAWYLTHLAGIEHIFPWPVLYASTVALLVGNAVFVLTMVNGCFGRRNYEDVKWALLAPVYWIMMSVAAWKAFIQLCYKPFYWEKTVHGFCTYEAATEDEANASRDVLRPAVAAFAEA